MMAAGRRSKTFEIAVSIWPTGTVSVPKHSTATLTGRATPMAYAICTSQRPARPAAGEGTTEELHRLNQGTVIHLRASGEHVVHGAVHLVKPLDPCSGRCGEDTVGDGGGRRAQVRLDRDENLAGRVGRMGRRQEDRPGGTEEPNRAAAPVLRGGPLGLREMPNRENRHPGPLRQGREWRERSPHLLVVGRTDPFSEERHERVYDEQPRPDA